MSRLINMRRFLAAAALALSILGATPLAHAQQVTNAPSFGPTTSTVGSGLYNDGSLNAANTLTQPVSPITSASQLTAPTTGGSLYGASVPAAPSTTNAPSTGSAGFTALAPIPGLTDTSVTSVINATSLATFFNNLYKYFIGLGATLAVIQIIWAGLDIAIWHKDAVSAITDDKGKIYNAVFGLVLLLSPVLVFTIINPSILNLSINLPPLNTATTNTPSSGVSATDSSSGCTVTGSPSVFQIAICPSAAAAQTWGQQCTGGAILSAMVPITNNADGSVGQNYLTCTHSNIFEFIDLATLKLTATPMGRLQPLSVASNTHINGSNTLYSTNGSDAIQYATTCASIGYKTCLSDNPSYTISHTCSPLPSGQLPVGATVPATCYTETLSCEYASFINGKCASNPGWTPFQ